MNLILSIGFCHFNFLIETKQINVNKRRKTKNNFHIFIVDISFLEEEIYVIAMHLDLFLRHCFPKWHFVFSIASKIMTDLSTNDGEFYDHLLNISKIRTKINPKVS